MITIAESDAERSEVQALFQAHFPGIAPNAVPRTEHDDLYAPLVARYADEASGRLIGAALTCRAQVAAGAVLRERAGLPDGGYSPLRDRHSELDLICVVEESRGRGVGGQLIEYLEHRLRDRGVRVWFGSITEDLDLQRLRSFYTRHGFTVTDDGQPLPPLLGKNWIPPSTQPAAFYFYKTLTYALRS